MRRMLTEKDIEKIESIAPADIEKLKSIDPADIETLKATGSPKGAKSGYVLTADGNGKAIYKYKSGGTLIQGNMAKQISKTGYETDADGNKFISSEFWDGAIISAVMRGSLKADNVVIPRAEYTLTWIINYTGGNDRVVIYLPDETITKYSITAQTNFTGYVSLYYYK